MPAPWAMPLCFTLLQTQKTHQVRSVVGRKDIEGNVPSWLTCSSPLGGGLGRAVAFLSLILGSLHPPPRPWGRGNLFSRVGQGQLRKGWRVGVRCSGVLPLKDPTSARGWKEGLVLT